MPHALPQVCFASLSVGAGTLNRVASDAVATDRHPHGYQSPIDTAYDTLRVVTQVAASATPTWQPEHGLILSTSAVAAAEDYFRSILTEVIELCELCKQRAQPFETRMEFVFSGSVADALRGMLDRESFSSRENVLAWSKKVTGSDLGRARSLNDALGEFERVCHIRHAAIHAGGYLSTHNAKALGVPAGTWISFDSPKGIYEIISVVTATIRSFNQVLFEQILTGWIADAALKGVWTDDKDKFSSLWTAFSSTGDIDSDKAAGNGILKDTPYKAYLTVRKAVRARVVAGV
jgi:hypothetical protein